MVPGLDRIAAKPYQNGCKPAAADWTCLLPHSKPVVRRKKSHMRALVDRRVSLMDSLIVQFEMALLTVGMSLARIETVGSNQRDGCR